MIIVLLGIIYRIYGFENVGSHIGNIASTFLTIFLSSTTFWYLQIKLIIVEESNFEQLLVKKQNIEKEKMLLKEENDLLGQLNEGIIVVKNGSLHYLN
jgi:hypothetical protein